MTKQITKTLCCEGFEITYELRLLGEDLLLLVSGGTEHVGSVALALPRESLLGDGSKSSTSSVLNAPSHKDEFIIRSLAERLSTLSGHRVAAVGGVHFDALDKAGLAAVAKIETIATEQAASWLQELNLLK